MTPIDVASRMGRMGLTGRTRRIGRATAEVRGEGAGAPRAGYHGFLGRETWGHYTMDAGIPWFAKTSKKFAIFDFPFAAVLIRASRGFANGGWI